MLMDYITYLKARLGSKKGQGMVEYGLIIGIVAVILIAVLTILRDPLKGLFQSIGGLLTGQGNNITAGGVTAGT